MDLITITFLVLWFATVKIFIKITSSKGSYLRFVNTLVIVENYFWVLSKEISSGNPGYAFLKWLKSSWAGQISHTQANHTGGQMLVNLLDLLYLDWKSTCLVMIDTDHDFLCFSAQLYVMTGVDRESVLGPISASALMVHWPTTVKEISRLLPEMCLKTKLLSHQVN